jgi:tripartite-type tricarboxylate transporter receptor subunit TctC
LAMTVLSKLSGVEITHIPYKGGGPAITDVIGGHVDMIAGSVALVLPQLSGGALRPLLQMGRTRLPALPNVPTAIESGFADFEALAWWGVFAPAGTPPAIISRTTDAFIAVLKDPTISRQLQETQQIELALEGPEKFSVFFTRQVKQWGKVVRDNNIQAN